jgi:hypothetical protein
MLPSAKQVAEALKPKRLIFGLTIHHIPTINLRQQYARDRAIVPDQALADTIHEWMFGRTHGASVNYPEPDAYFSMLLRSTIVGIECTLQNLAIEELAFSNRLTKAVYHAVRNPSTLARSMVEAYYNKIPEHVGVNASLKKCTTMICGGKSSSSTVSAFQVSRSRGRRCAWGGCQRGRSLNSLLPGRGSARTGVRLPHLLWHSLRLE